MTLIFVLSGISHFFNGKMLHKTSYYWVRGCYLCFTISFASVFIAAGIFAIYTQHAFDSGNTRYYNNYLSIKPYDKQIPLRFMLNDSINLLNFSCSGNCDVPVAAIVGGGFILAGCVMIMIVLCIFRYTGRLNDEYAIKERLRRDVSST